MKQRHAESKHIIEVIDDLTGITVAVHDDRSGEPEPPDYARSPDAWPFLRGSETCARAAVVEAQQSAEYRRWIETVPFSARVGIASLMAKWHWRRPVRCLCGDPSCPKCGEHVLALPHEFGAGALLAGHGISGEPSVSDEHMAVHSFAATAMAAVSLVVENSVDGSFTADDLDGLRALVRKHRIVRWVSERPNCNVGWLTTDSARETYQRIVR